MGKGTHFIGQPVFGQLVGLLDKRKILNYSRGHGGERYVKKFDAWQHLVIMLYAVIKRFDSLREISGSMFPEARKLGHLGISVMPRRSTLSDANARRPDGVFAFVYRSLYEAYRKEISSDSRKRQNPGWMDRLRIMDSTTISLFSGLVFRGVGRSPRTGRRKGGVKVHSVIHANEGVPSDVRLTSAATHDSFMLCPSDFSAGGILAMDRAYIGYGKLEELSQRGVVYVTKMRRNLRHEVLEDCMAVSPGGLVELRVRHVMFTKHLRDRDDIVHHAGIITYVDVGNGRRPRPVRLLTNDFGMPPEEIAAIYKRRWQIESLFKQLKQNFPLR